MCNCSQKSDQVIHPTVLSMQRQTRVDDDGWVWYDEALEVNYVPRYTETKCLFEAIHLSTLLDKGGEQDICPICLETGSTGHEGAIRKSPVCCHPIHVKCFLKYLMEGGVRCPTCRTRLVYDGSSARSMNEGISLALGIPLSADGTVDLSEDVVEDQREEFTVLLSMD